MFSTAHPPVVDPRLRQAALILAVAEHNGDQCTEVGMACSTRCQTDADCSALGDNFVCFDGCDGDKSCAGTG